MSGEVPVLDLTGSRFADLLRGLSGRDTIRGGDGNDNLAGRDGDDLIVGDGGRDRLSGGDGDDTIAAGSEVGGEALLGGAGFDRLVVSGFIDVTAAARATGFESLQLDSQTRLGQRFFEALDELYVAGAGAQIRAAEAGAWAFGALSIIGSANATLSFIGSDGADLITGIGLLNLDFGDGVTTFAPPLTLANDSIFAGAGNDTVYGDSGNDLIVGGEGADRILGEDGNDNLLGDLGNDSVDGGEGDDTVDGGAGTDTLVGSFGDDLYRVDSVFDLVIEGAGAGYDTVQSQVAWTLGANLERLVLVANASVGNGNALGNVIEGNVLNDALAGLDGSDSLFGNDGSDTLSGGTGVDDLRGGAGDDSLLGGADADVLDGGLGADTVAGGTGDDVYLIDDLFDSVTESFGEGLDLVLASTSHTLATFVEYLTLTGSAAANGTGNDSANYILGNAGANALAGAAGDDTLDGGLGNDTLTGGLGTDSLIGGDGGDRFVYLALNESNGAIPGFADIVADFQADGRDKIDVSAIDALPFIRGNNAFTYIGGSAFTAAGQVRAESVGGNTVLRFNTDSDFGTTEMSVRVVIAAGTLDATDIIL